MGFLLRFGIHAGQDRPHERVGVGTDGDRDLLEPLRLAAHQVRAQEHAPAVDDRDREHGCRLVPTRIGHDPASGREIVTAWPVEAARVPVPVANVVGGEASKEEVQERLLPIRIRREASGCAEGAGSRRDRERDDDRVVDRPTDQHVPGLGGGVSEALLLDAGEDPRCQNQGEAHQKPSPERDQLR